MRSRLRHWSLAVLALAIPAAGWAADARSFSAYPGLHGEVLLDNEFVLVERYDLAPGARSGAPAPGADRVLVFLADAELRPEPAVRRTLWRRGRTLWLASGTRDGRWVNSGHDPASFVVVSLKRAAAARPSDEDFHLGYPNIPGEDLLENDRVVVQRFLVGPGQWEGVHAHRPHMVYIHLVGGQWAARSYHEPAHVYPDPSPDGKVGWMDPVGIDVGHESQNAGPSPIDLVWVTLKD